MAIWNKKEINKTTVQEISKKYSLNPITASIFARRGITTGKDILYYLEDDLRFQHNPFLFSAMEDAVDRILQAIEKDKEGNCEKILVFGDKDVDGITATTVLYEYLKKQGADVKYKVPQGTDPYGLTVEAVEKFADEYGSLIITVDCGIANTAEIALAREKGIDVIVVDHHNPQESLPEDCIILDAWLNDSGYPFPEISGCAVVYKLVSALRFAKSDWYKTDAALLNARESENGIMIECIRLRNLVPVSKIEEMIIPGEKSIADTRLPSYLSGQIILCWDIKKNLSLLQTAFGTGTQFNMMDIRDEVAKMYPSMKTQNLNSLKKMSKIARYGDHDPTEIGGFYNIFVTWVQQTLKKQFPSIIQDEERDLQLVALAALADVMPMQNENRIFVKKGLESINAGRIRGGLLELMSQLNLLGKKITATNLSWDIIPNLNAAGRLGHAEIAVELFLADTSDDKNKAASQITAYNTERKKLTEEALDYSRFQSSSSITDNYGKLCLVIDERINKGVCGIVAGRLVNTFDVPAIVITYVDDIAIGSIRSCRDFDVTPFLEKISDLFISHGGHDFAAGFSFYKARIEEFKSRVRELSKEIQLSEGKSTVQEIDAEVPALYMTKELIDIYDTFEPYGNKNPPLVFMSKNLPVISGMILGKTERQHLKITVDSGKSKWPCLFWNEGNRWKRDFQENDRVNILYKVERNVFNGMEILQLNLSDIEKSN